MHDLELTQKHWEILAATSEKPAGKIAVTAPYDGTQIATLDTAGSKHVDDALAAAYKLYRNRASWLPAHERAAILTRAAAIMEQHQALLELEAAREGGKPILDSRAEVTRAIDGVRICIEHIRANAGEIIPMDTTVAGAGRIAFTQKEPVGVVVAVSAFNHPLNLIVHQVASAVAAGCPVIVKPANNTPLSCLRFVMILHAAGLPADWAQVLVTDTNETASELVTDSRVGFFSFIGSPAVGWMLRSKLAAGTRCALEHGGAAPLILAKDADLQLALPAILKGGFYHAGQVCVSVQRVYAHRAFAADFAQQLACEASDLVIGDPTSEDTAIGPLISHAETERVHSWVEAAVAGGAIRLAGGEPLSPSLYPATVLLDPPEDADVSSKEIFGPVVCVYSYDDIEDAVTRANSLPFAFQAAVFTSDIDTALQLYKQLDASAVMVNDHSAFRVDGMPFAGLRQSGLGVGGIPYSIEDMQIDKMLVIKSSAL